MKLVQHHVKYEELHGVDEIILLTPKEHMKAHRELKANGVKSVRLWRVNAAHKRSPMCKAARKLCRQTEANKTTAAAYRQTERGKAKAKVDGARHAKTEKGKATDARYRQSEKGKYARVKCELRAYLRRNDLR